MREMIVSAMLVAPAAVPAAATDMVGFRANAVQSVFHGPVQTYERETSNKVKFNFGTAGAIVKHLATGEPDDVVSTTARNLAELTRADKMEGSTINNLDSIAEDIAAKRDAYKYDADNLTAFKATNFAARSITCTNPAAGADLFKFHPENTAQIGQTVFKAERFSINYAVIQRALSKVDIAPTFELGLADCPEVWAESLTQSIVRHLGADQLEKGA